MPITYRKRQKEMKRREKQRIKEERREQKKLANRAAREGGVQNTTDSMIDENWLETSGLAELAGDPLEGSEGEARGEEGAGATAPESTQIPPEARQEHSE